MTAAINTVFGIKNFSVLNYVQRKDRMETFVNPCVLMELCRDRTIN